MLCNFTDYATSAKLVNNFFGNKWKWFSLDDKAERDP